MLSLLQEDTVQEKATKKNHAKLLEPCLPEKLECASHIAFLLIKFIPVCNCYCHETKTTSAPIVFGCRIKVCKERDCWECSSCKELQCTNCKKYLEAKNDNFWNGGELLHFLQNNVRHKYEMLTKPQKEIYERYASVDQQKYVIGFFKEGFLKLRSNVPAWKLERPSKYCLCQHNNFGKKCACKSCNVTDCSPGGLKCESCSNRILCDEKRCKECCHLLCDSCGYKCLKCHKFLGCRSIVCDKLRQNSPTLLVLGCITCFAFSCSSCQFVCEICQKGKLCGNTDCLKKCSICKKTGCSSHFKSCAVCEVKYCCYDSDLCLKCEECLIPDVEEGDSLGNTTTSEKDDETDSDDMDENLTPFFPNLNLMTNTNYYGLPKNTEIKFITPDQVLSMLLENFSNDFSNSDSEFETKTTTTTTTNQKLNNKQSKPKTKQSKKNEQVTSKQPKPKIKTSKKKEQLKSTQPKSKSVKRKRKNKNSKLLKF